MIKPLDGLFLTGTLVASDINQGLRKDDGKPWATRTAMNTTGKTCITYGESIPMEEIGKVTPFQIGSRVNIEVTYTNTNSGVISVGGNITLIDDSTPSK